MCRRILACASNILPHTEGKSPIWFDFPRHLNNDDGGAGENDDSSSTVHVATTSASSSASDGGGGPSSTTKLEQHLILPSPPICTQMLFTEPLAWMTTDVTQNLQGKIHCPNLNCKSKLGSFSWVMGKCKNQQRKKNDQEF
jgi:hypothetical protein